MTHRPTPPRRGEPAIVHATLWMILLLVVLQLWLLTATMNAFLGGDTTVPLPAAVASAVCLAICALLLRYSRHRRRP